MKKILLAVLVAILLTILVVPNMAKTYKNRILFDFIVSDSDEVAMRTRTHTGLSDSIFIIAGLERGIQVQLYFLPWGGDGDVRLIWFYGLDEDAMLPETLCDTTIAADSTFTKIYTITNWKGKWGRFQIEDSLDNTNGDSVKIGLFTIEQ